LLLGKSHKSRMLATTLHHQPTNQVRFPMSSVSLELGVALEFEDVVTLLRRGKRMMSEGVAGAGKRAGGVDGRGSKLGKVWRMDFFFSFFPCVILSTLSFALFALSAPSLSACGCISLSSLSFRFLPLSVMSGHSPLTSAGNLDARWGCRPGAEG
jgi:hypothetical protein